MENKGKLLWMINAVLTSVKRTVENNISVSLNYNYYREYSFEYGYDVPDSVLKTIPNYLDDTIIQYNILVIRLNKDLELTVLINGQNELIERSHVTEIKKNVLKPNKEIKHEYSAYKYIPKYLIRFNLRSFEITKSEYETLIEKAKIFMDELEDNRENILIDVEYNKLRKIL